MEFTNGQSIKSSKPVAKVNFQEEKLQSFQIKPFELHISHDTILDHTNQRTVRACPRVLIPYQSIIHRLLGSQIEGQTILGMLCQMTGQICLNTVYSLTFKLPSNNSFRLRIKASLTLLYKQAKSRNAAQNEAFVTQVQVELCVYECVLSGT